MFSRGQAAHPPKVDTKRAEPFLRGSGPPQAEEKNHSGRWAGSITYQDLRSQAPVTSSPRPQSAWAGRWATGSGHPFQLYRVFQSCLCGSEALYFPCSEAATAQIDGRFSTRQIRYKNRVMNFMQASNYLGESRAGLLRQQDLPVVKDSYLCFNEALTTG